MLYKRYIKLLKPAFCLLFVLCCAAAASLAQPGSLIKIATKDNFLLLSVQNKHVMQLHYGSKLADNDIPSLPRDNATDIYQGFGINVSSASLKITHADGNPTTDLVYVRHTTTQPDANTVLTKIELKDAYYPVEVNLYYKSYFAENMIEQWAEITHQEKGNAVIADIASAGLAIERSAYYVTYFNGDWSREFNMYEAKLQPGTFTLDSKEGVRTDQKTNPSFLLSLDNKLNEDNGNVIGATLAWPGNWQIQFNIDQNNKLHVSPGINTYTANYVLAPGKVFKAPSFIYTFSNGGAGEVTRRFHRWARKYGITNGSGDRDVVLNNWETTGFDFDEAKLNRLIKDAGQLGFDLFLLDDGWFGNKHPRNTDQAGLGDWEVNHKKLPNGLSGLIKESQANKIKFGLWVEPEMVNPRSELYEKHPEWALSAPNRPRDEQRNQLILDLANPKVQDYIVGTISKLLDENKGLNYLKWDCNRYLTNAWSNFLGKDKQANLYVDYAAGYLTVLKRLRAKYPDVVIMLCASGGGRMDYGSLPYHNEYWPSDNSNAHDRAGIQWGTGYFYPAIGFAAHVSEMGQNTSLKFRLDVAMAGKLGMDMQPDHLNAQEKEFLKNAISTYKRIKDIVFFGDVYRLLSPYEFNRAALMYVTEDKAKALVFTYQVKKGAGGDFTTTYLKGLNPDANYKLTEINKGSYTRVGDYEGKILSGKYLMEQGLKFSMWNIDESNIIQLEKQ